jgi:uncharacterized protein (DUF302 family)
MTPDGLVICVSSLSPEKTMDRLAAAVTNHRTQPPRPTEVLIFGSPRAETPLVQAAQTTCIDLPLKALVWQAGGTTRLT